MAATSTERTELWTDRCRVTAPGEVSRRRFLKLSTTAVAALVPRSRLAHPTRGRPQPAAGYDFVEPDSTFFATAFAEYAASYGTSSDGDLWPSAWADDDNTYAANGDGTGFSNPTSSDVVVNRISGTPRTGLAGASLSSGAAVAEVWGNPGGLQP